MGKSVTSRIEALERASAAKGNDSTRIRIVIDSNFYGNADRLVALGIVQNAKPRILAEYDLCSDETE